MITGDPSGDIGHEIRHGVGNFLCVHAKPISSSFELLARQIGGELLKSTAHIRRFLTRSCRVGLSQKLAPEPIAPICRTGSSVE